MLNKGGCHALAAWSITFVAAKTTSYKKHFYKAGVSTRQARGIHPNCRRVGVAANVKYHGARPWHQFDF